jgi:hypothetical protein
MTMLASFAFVGILTITGIVIYLAFPSYKKGPAFVWAVVGQFFAAAILSGSDLAYV